MLTGHEKDGDLVQNYGARLHQLQFELAHGGFLACAQVVMIDHLNCHVDRLSGLSELDAHFVDSIDNPFAPLHMQNTS